MRDGPGAGALPGREAPRSSTSGILSPDAQRPPLPFRQDLADFFSSPPYYDELDLWRIRPMLSPHPDAPLFSRPDGQEAFRQLLAEAESGKFPTTEAFLDLIRQAATVSLWFFLRVVASHRGAYDKINSQLHLEMCNFRQVALEPGGYYAMLTPRGSYKSTIADHGAAPWELVRDSELTIGIFSAVSDKSQEFYLQAKDSMENNEFFRELWPKIVPGSTGRGSEWTDSSLNVASRRRRKATPSLAAYTASGSVSGTHIGLSIIDDIVTDAMLNAARQATADLVEKTNWFKTNIDSLREDVATSRTLDIGTRYSIEDPHEITQADAVEQFGDWTACQARYPRRADGQWRTYYRSAKATVGDRIVSIQPAAYSVEFLDKLAKRDPWTYHYQYENNAIGTGASDLAGYSPAECEFTDEGVRITNTDEFIRWGALDVTVAIDPAGRDSRASVRTSQTAMVIVAQDALKRKFVSGKKGYVKTTQWLDWIFSQAAFFGEILGRTVVEEAAGFKALDSIIIREQYERGIRLKYRSTPSLGEKINTIRSILQPEFEAGRIYVDKKLAGPLDEEMKAFPGNAMDILDALKIGIKFSRLPADEASVAGLIESVHDSFSRLSNSTAY